jgi:16S rRNA (guanine527-N7)-methyltransferase
MVTRETEVAEKLRSVGLPNDPETVRRLARLEERLRVDGISEGFVGPNETGRIWERHIFESAAVLPFLTEGDLVDVGSGAGLPGLVLACFGVRVKLIDSLSKRATFVGRLAREIGLPAEAIHGRAEDVARETSSRDASANAVARALAPPPVALELCLPFVRATGRCLLLATPSADPDSDLTGIERVARELGGGAPTWSQLRVPGGGLDRWVIMVEKIGPTPDRYPRRAGLPERRPLG